MEFLIDRMMMVVRGILLLLMLVEVLVNMNAMAVTDTSYMSPFAYIHGGRC